MKTQPRGVNEMNRLLEKRQLFGVWNVKAEDRPVDPKTKVKPYLWRWADVYDSLLQARDMIGIDSAGSVERRTIGLVNPGVNDTTHTMHVAFQLLQPGEVAHAHRHSVTAGRFVLQGKGGYTVVEGEKMVMGEGDLILTPQGTWHEHAHEGEEPMVWLDGLDLPLVESLQVISFELYPDKRLPQRAPHYEPDQLGMTRPVTRPGTKLPAPLHYRWQETYRSLKLLSEKEAHPYEGVALEFVNPLTGNSTLPTLSFWIQMLRPAERTQGHRHTSTTIYHVFRGSGTTVINGEPIHWEKGDTFVVPLWSWHEHANRSAAEEAILYSMHDTPVLEALGLYREEAQGGPPMGL